MKIAALAPTALALVFASSIAAAQSFNIDVGDNAAFPAPSAGYGAAANQSGVWNALLPPFGGALVSLSGSSTGVSVSTNYEFAVNNCGGALPVGDDAALMADAQSVPGFALPTEWTFEGLVNGKYVVHTYAWCTLSITGSAVISVVDSPDPLQLVTGDWTGSPHVQGVTYARHQVTVTDGSLVVRASSASPIDASGVLNGFQLTLELPDTGNFCTSTPNSTGAPAVISFTGSVSVAANDLVLRAAPVPNTPGIFFYGARAIQQPFGNGLRCVGAPTYRLQPPTFASGGVLEHALDLTAPPVPAGSITPGSAWFFQAWFRDPVGAGFDLSDGLSAAFVP